ncbi:MAG: hypothetical protein KAI08_13400 [Bacteroidales bacterium]|nr:hypothetical protein [Bacteroidales bacterium]
MLDKRKTGTVTLFWLAILPLWGGTGRPNDGFLSFILIFGFLVVLLGLLQVASYVKKRIQELLEDIF